MKQLFTLLFISMAFGLSAQSYICDGTTTTLDPQETNPAAPCGAASYLWSDNSTGSTLVVSASGTYDVTITYAGCGCTETSSLQIIECPAIAGTPTPTDNTDCVNCNGTATVANITGGCTGTFTYLWDAAAANQTTAVATGLCAGSYNVTITDTQTTCDGGNCDMVFTVVVADNVMPTVVPMICN